MRHSPETDEAVTAVGEAVIASLPTLRRIATTAHLPLTDLQLLWRLVNMATEADDRITADMWRTWDVPFTNKPPTHKGESHEQEQQQPSQPH